MRTCWRSSGEPAGEAGRRVIGFDGARNKYSITSYVHEHEKMKFFGRGFVAP